MNYYAGFGIVLLSLGGIYLDYKLQTGYFCTFTGLFLGVIYVAYEIWKSTRKN